jgi:hypothetical protein
MGRAVILLLIAACGAEAAPPPAPAASIERAAPVARAAPRVEAVAHRTIAVAPVTPVAPARPEPAVRIDELTTTAPDARPIQAAIDGQLAGFEACYRTARAAAPTLTGTLLLTFAFAPTGAVTEAKAAGVSPALDACVAAVLKHLRLPRQAGTRPLHARVPILFRPL